MELNGWTRKGHIVEHEFECEPGTVPDLQDTRVPRRMVIRPRTVTLHQIPDSNLVWYATIEGRQVKRDGELAGRKMILAGCTEWRDSSPPWWLNDMLAELGFDWAANRPVPAP